MGIHCPLFFQSIFKKYMSEQNPQTTPTEQKTPEQIGRMRAIKDLLGVNGIIASLGAIGFGAMAYVIGATLRDTLLNEFGIHGLPGQMSHINITATGGGFLITFFAVGFANFRMFPMVVSTMGFIQEHENLQKPFWVWLILMHGCVSSTWIRTLALCEDLPSRGRYTFYKTMALTFLVVMPVFIVIGFLWVQTIAHPWNLLLSILAPIFMFIQGVSATHRDTMTASALGLISIVGLYPILNLWAIIVGGVGSSLTAYVLWHTNWGKSINPLYNANPNSKGGDR